MKASIWTRLLDVVSPRLCPVCGERLTVTEEVVCGRCLMHLPYTGFECDAYENPMARLFWGQLPIERAAALFYYEAQSEVGSIVRRMKYDNHPEVARFMGRLAARQFAARHFFDGIDGIVPVPLARKRQRQRGYNQSMEIALGVSQLTGLPVYNKVARRTVFEGSQTRLNLWQRRANVADVFEMTDARSISGKHLLLVDDIVTTGATVTACGHAMLPAGHLRLSVLSLGFAKS